MSLDCLNIYLKNSSILVANDPVSYFFKVDKTDAYIYEIILSFR